MIRSVILFTKRKHKQSPTVSPPSRILLNVVSPLFGLCCFLFLVKDADDIPLVNVKISVLKKVVSSVTNVWGMGVVSWDLAKHIC